MANVAVEMNTMGVIHSALRPMAVTLALIGSMLNVSIADGRSPNAGSRTNQNTPSEVEANNEHDGEVETGDLPGNRANIVLETVNVIRARPNRGVTAQSSIDQTNLSLGITEGLL